MNSKEKIQMLNLKLKLADGKIAELVSTIKSLEEKQAIYISKSLDKVDEYLGKFINSYVPRNLLKIQFIREQEGVYRFGSKRVYITIDKSNRVLVRIGGGYIPVQDFVEQYTPSEVEKVHRNNTLHNFRNRSSAQKHKRDPSHFDDDIEDHEATGDDEGVN